MKQKFFSSFSLLSHRFLSLLKNKQTITFENVILNQFQAEVLFSFFVLFLALLMRSGLPNRHFDFGTSKMRDALTMSFSLVRLTYFFITSSSFTRSFSLFLRHFSCRLTLHLVVLTLLQPRLLTISLNTFSLFTFFFFFVSNKMCILCKTPFCSQCRRS